MKTVLIPLATLLTALISQPVLANDPWGAADPKAGKALHDKACVACHTRLYGDDGSKIYTRNNRLLSTKLELLKRVATCNAQTKAGFLPKEEAEVAAYLNQQYYHFKE